MTAGTTRMMIRQSASALLRAGGSGRCGRGLGRRCSEDVRGLARGVLLNNPLSVSSTASSSSSSSFFHSSTTARAPPISSPAGGPSAAAVTTPWADPAMRQYKYWNRETNAADANRYKDLLEFSPESIVKEAKILSLSALDDPANTALHSTHGLPIGTTLLGVGSELSDFDHVRTKNPNVLFVSPSCPRASVTVPLVLAAFPSIEWIHVRSAGIDFVESSEFGAMCSSQNITVTNAKGQFSSSLAEYALLACSYFAKNVPRLIKQQSQGKWEKYDIEELRGKTLGVVGYGDIGKACVKLATVYGMRVVALRRHPFLSRDDPYCDKVYGRDKDSLNQLMAESDYIVCSAPSTVETRGMVSAEAFDHVKQNAVFINLGRGPVVDEVALTRALQSGRLKGAALDVFVEEPLPASSELWKMPNVLISPHNMDQTSTFMHEATEFFLRENLPRFVCGEDLLNPVDPMLGY